MDIRDRLKKLASLVRHDEEALSTCEDAIKEFDRLMPAGDAGAAANAAASHHSWYYPRVTFSAPPPPSQNTQVKWGAWALHYSDCAINNGPAYEPGQCDCGGLGRHLDA